MCMPHMEPSVTMVTSIMILLSDVLHAILVHHCSYPGCNITLVLDGNMKNRRDVCAATEAGCNQYEDLPEQGACQLL